jgi:hypothetical protein
MIFLEIYVQPTRYTTPKSQKYEPLAVCVSWNGYNKLLVALAEIFSRLLICVNGITF